MSSQTQFALILIECFQTWREPYQRLEQLLYILRYFYIPVGNTLQRPQYVLKNNLNVFIVKIFLSHCSFLETKHLITTVFNPQTMEKAEKCSKTTIARLNIYVAGLQVHWNAYVQLLAYGYRTQVNASLIYCLSSRSWRRSPMASSRLIVRRLSHLGQQRVHPHTFIEQCCYIHYR